MGGNDEGPHNSRAFGDPAGSRRYEPFEFYRVDVSEQDASPLAGGTQDNGVNRSYGGTGWNGDVFGVMGWPR